MNADLQRALDAVHVVITSSHLPGWKENRANWALVTQAMRDHEAEIARLRDVADGNAELYQHELLRTQKAEALLREVLPDLYEAANNSMHDLITAHLGAEQ